MPRECSFESRLQRLSRLRLRQTSSNISSSSTRTLARDNLVNFSTLLVDPCSVLVLKRREPRLNSLKDLLLRVEEFECRLVFESFEEHSISRLRSGGRVDEFYSSILSVRWRRLYMIEIVSAMVEGDWKRSSSLHTEPWRKTWLLALFERQRKGQRDFDSREARHSLATGLRLQTMIKVEPRTGNESGTSAHDRRKKARSTHFDRESCI